MVQSGPRRRLPLVSLLAPNTASSWNFENSSENLKIPSSTFWVREHLCTDTDQHWPLQFPHKHRTWMSQLSNGVFEICPMRILAIFVSNRTKRGKAFALHEYHLHLASSLSPPWKITIGKEGAPHFPGALSTLYTICDRILRLIFSIVFSRKKSWFLTIEARDEENQTTLTNIRFMKWFLDLVSLWHCWLSP